MKKNKEFIITATKFNEEEESYELTSVINDVSIKEFDSIMTSVVLKVYEELAKEKGDKKLKEKMLQRFILKLIAKFEKEEEK